MNISNSPTKRHVAAGSFAIGVRGSGGNAYANLGTCVGVILCDPIANVGGLIHLLLSEPPRPDSSWQPENYASTGLPLFIQALCDAGAHRQRLEAYVAGGALIGPLSEADVVFDIGGRTSETVEKILLSEKIPIRKSETGGSSFRRLSLNFDALEIRIDPLGLPVCSSTDIPLKKTDIRELDRTIENLHPIPQIVLKIIRMIRHQDDSVHDIAREIGQDQVISAKVLRLCNSALFGITTKIHSIERASILLGAKQILPIILTASMEQLFQQNPQGYSLCKGGLYHHALATAMTAENLARLTGKAPTDIAYTAGLIHDIGKVVLDQYMTAAYPFFYRRTQVDAIDLIAVEKETFGVTHTEAGRLVAERWSLPEDLADMILHHHDPEHGTIHPKLTHIVYLADFLMSRFLVGQELEMMDTESLASRMSQVGLSLEQFPLLIDSIPRRAFMAASLDVQVK